jgi:hypothetical protein
MNSCIYTTDPNWLSSLRNHPLQTVNFWRKDHKKFTLSPGAHIYFKIRKTSWIAGRAEFSNQTSRSIADAWKEFGLGNGVGSEDELKHRAHYVLDITPGEPVNCLILKKVEFLQEGNYIEITNKEYPPAQNPFRILDDNRIARIRHEFSLRLQNQLPLLSQLEAVAAKSEIEGHFNPANIASAKEYIFRSIAQRRGQPKFRQRLLVAYSGRCAVTGTDTPYVLEAAHIVPYNGKDTNVVQNGLLLRADWHLLFDLGLWTLSEEFAVMISEKLASSEYWKFAGHKLNLSDSPDDRPSQNALKYHRENLFAPK